MAPIWGLGAPIIKEFLVFVLVFGDIKHAELHIVRYMLVCVELYMLSYTLSYIFSYMLSYTYKC